jgi:hypothetical protein
MEFAAMNVRWKQSFESEDHKTGNVRGTDLYPTRIVVEIMQMLRDDHPPCTSLLIETCAMQLQLTDHSRLHAGRK